MLPSQVGQQLPVTSDWYRVLFLEADQLFRGTMLGYEL